MHRFLEILAVILVGALLFVLAEQFTVLATRDMHVLVFIAPVLLAALALADLLSGIMHFLLDCKGHPETPFWGVFIRPFREHHIDPAEMTRHDFVHTNGHTAMAICPLLMLVLLAYREPMNTVETLQFVFLCALLFFLALTNQFHKWAHDRNAPRLVRWLQASRLVLSAQHHAMHHATYRDHFCITTGWNNAWLARTQLLQKVFQGDPGPTTVAENGVAHQEQQQLS